MGCYLWGHTERDMTEATERQQRPSSWLGFQVALAVKNLPVYTGDIRDENSIPASGRSPGGGHGNPLQCSCLENSMDRRAWRATVHRVTKSQT